MSSAASKKATPTVFIVDDDLAVRDAIRWLMEQVKLKVQVFALPTSSSPTMFQARGDASFSISGCLE